MENNNYSRYKWTTIWLTVGTILGLITVGAYAFSTRANLGLLVLWSLVYLVIGALMGFIFSVPKLISDIKAPAVDTTNLNESDIVKARVATLKNNIQENTNLTQISDWLTKVIVGATLVEIKEVPKFIYKVAKYMGKGIIVPCGSTMNYDQTTIFCVGIILFFSTWGFICGYLVMKLVLTEQFADISN